MKNKYEIREDVTAIVINSPKYGIFETLISTRNLERANAINGSWYIHYIKANDTFYVLGNIVKENGRKTTTYLHRWISNVEKGKLVDHFNHNGLDNTDGNIRITTGSENQQNRESAQKNNTLSGIRGVAWHNRDKLWIARFSVKGKRINVGYFKDIKDAERAVIEARAKYMPYSQEASA